MKKLLAPLTSLAAAAALSACGGLHGQPQPQVPLADVTVDDTPDLTDLIDVDADGAAAAAQLGDPATLLGLAQDQAEHVRSDVANVAGFVQKATNHDPDAHGRTALGQPFARWDTTDQQSGNTVHVFAVRTAPERVRLLVQGENAAGLSLPLMTGVFVKKAPRVGGGRFHVSFTNYSNLFLPEGQGADGSLHFLFANARPDLHGRRVLYVNVDDRSTPPGDGKSFAADLVRLVGVGGRFRSIYADDLNADLPGKEAVGLRVAWRAGQGGRADAVIATQANGGQILAVAHECWDESGLRTAYKDSVPNNDDDPNAGPDEGDVTNCFDLADDTVDQGRVQQDGAQDTDPDLDSALDDAGANDVSDADASDDSIPEDAP